MIHRYKSHPDSETIQDFLYDFKEIS